MQIPGFRLYIEVIQNDSAFIWPEFILHPLTYVSTDLPFIQQPLLQTMRKQDTLCLFFSVPFPLSCSSVWRIVSRKNHCFGWIQWTILGCSLMVWCVKYYVLYWCNVTQSFKIPWEMKQKKIENPWVFALHPGHFVLPVHLFCIGSCALAWQWVASFCMLFTVNVAFHHL